MTAIFPSTYIVYLTHILMMLSISAFLISGKTFLLKLMRPVFNNKAQNKNDKYESSMLALAAGAGGGLILFFIGMPALVCGFVGVLLFIIIPRIILKKQQKAYKENFELSLTESLSTISSSLKAGLTLKDALLISSQNCPPAFAAEASIAIKEYKLGVPLEDALDHIRKRINTPSANIAFGAMIIGSQLGGNLPEILKRIVVTIRDRERVEGKLKSLTAQGRAQAILLCSAPVVIGIAMYIYDPVKMGYLTSTVIGQFLLGLAIVLEVIGVLVTKKVMTLEI